MTDRYTEARILELEERVAFAEMERDKAIAEKNEQVAAARAKAKAAGETVGLFVAAVNRSVGGYEAPGSHAYEGLGREVKSIVDALRAKQHLSSKRIDDREAERIMTEAMGKIDTVKLLREVFDPFNNNNNEKS